MAERVFFLDARIDIRITVNDDGGALNFLVEVLETNGEIADLQGVFFDLSGGVPAGLSITNGLVTATGTNTLQLGQGVNLNGATDDPFDIGVRIGTPGIGADDIQSVSFSVSATGSLSVDLLDAQRFGIRLTSVGDVGGDRGDSLKIVGVPTEEPGENECEPQCVTLTESFENFESGDTVNRLTHLDGDLVIRVRGDRNGPDTAANDAMIFDSDIVPATGGDDDLLNGVDNLLIISEDNDASDPDDDADGGKLIFRFSEAVTMEQMTVVDAEEGGRIVGFRDGVRVGVVRLTEVNDGEIEVVDLGRLENIDRLVVHLNGSGAVDDFDFEVCRAVCCDDCLI